MLKNVIGVLKIVMAILLGCPYNDRDTKCESIGKWCRVGIWSTPRNSGAHAKSLKKVVDRCLKKQAEQDNE